MHVDLGDFRFLSATSPASGALSLVVSRSATTGHVQLIEVDPRPATGAAQAAAPPATARIAVQGEAARIAAPDAAPPQVPDAAIDAPADVASFGKALLASGSVVLGGVDFASGSSDLSEGSYPSLGALAGWLGANPGRSVILVGHTDATGSLEGNVALSRRRAESVRQRLIANWDVAADRVTAQGAGPLAPRASNLTEEGRTLNRRVEAVLLPGG